MIIIWIFASIIIFSIIVLVHEYGHFKTARIFWVRVEEFWLGIPPRAKKLFRDKEGTLFSLNWLPLWGFVKLTWEHAHSFLLYTDQNLIYDNDSLQKDIIAKKAIYDKKWNIVDTETLQEVLKKLQENNANYNLNKKPAWQQSIIILAWVCMNFFLSIFIFSLLFFIGVKPIWINTHLPTDKEILLIPTVEQAIKSGLIQYDDWVRIHPVSWSIAEQGWLKKDDIVLMVFDQIVQSPETLMEVISQNPNTQIPFKIKRAEKNITLSITSWEDGKIWAYLWENIILNDQFEYKFWPLTSVKYGILETYNQTMLTFKALWSLLRKIVRPETKQERSEAIQQVSWPIGIVDFISSALGNGVIFLIIIGAIISINLAVFNLLPIPALDGWRFLFIIINAFVIKIFGKKAIWEKLEGYIHVWFFLFLILLSIVIAYNDILKITTQ